MFVFLLQVRDLLINHRLHLFLVYMALVWIVWGWKAWLSRRYRPATTACDVSTAVLIPVVDEPVDLFREVLDRIVAQVPDEVHVVINGPPNPTLEGVCAEYESVDVTWTEVPGKRNALRIGVEQTTSEICVLVDSDTIWTTDTLDELVRPFADADVGGVTTRQRILEPERHILSRWADWMESLRNEYAMPAMSMHGTVGCLPGRTIAFRRSVLVDAMDNFLTERFLGIFLEVSDDRTLTNECLKQGYKTVYQSTSLVYTDAPMGVEEDGQTTASLGARFAIQHASHVPMDVAQRSSIGLLLPRRHHLALLVTGRIPRLDRPPVRRNRHRPIRPMDRHLRPRWRRFGGFGPGDRGLGCEQRTAPIPPPP